MYTHVPAEPLHIVAIVGMGPFAHQSLLSPGSVPISAQPVGAVQPVRATYSLDRATEGVNATFVPRVVPVRVADVVVAVDVG